MDFSQDMVRGSIVPIVLALLKDKPMYGYEMVKIVNARTNGRFEWREGTLYPALHKLEADRMVTSKWELVPGEKGDGRSRKYYYITDKGLLELTRRSEEWKEFSMAVNACILGA
jgi:PadR family transcriptional regulator, regulatory protein PadR